MIYRLCKKGLIRFPYHVVGPTDAFFEIISLWIIRDPCLRTLPFLSEQEDRPLIARTKNWIP